ncbi:MAG: indole-3-glycerol phosphate synthase TrpC [Opitutales bacterium]|nr:indole-3-glycerol phosphate synthase TrpC [Opitutales bacterium]
MDKLAEIMAHKRREMADRARPVRDAELARYAELTRPGKAFAQALRRDGGLAVISEVKRRSPSAGEIAPDADAVEQARIYYNAGADAISVLTDEKYFGGSIRDLWDINDLLGNRADAPPTLRKDFFVDPFQVVEAAEAGARCILIIVRALSDDEMARLRDAAGLAALDAIYEVHDEADVERALRQNAVIIGVNNRDLSRFVTDLAVSERIIPELPDDCIAISESGIRTEEDAARARACGADAVLIGEALMRMEKPERFIGRMHDAG